MAGNQAQSGCVQMMMAKAQCYCFSSVFTCSICSSFSNRHSPSLTADAVDRIVNDGRQQCDQLSPSIHPPLEHQVMSIRPIVILTIHLHNAYSHNEAEA